MATNPRLRATTTGGRRGSQKQVRALETGMNTVQKAIIDLLRLPKEERDAHILDLQDQLEELATKLKPLDAKAGPVAKRIQAVREVLRILRSAPDRPPTRATRPPGTSQAP